MGFHLQWGMRGQFRLYYRKYRKYHINAYSPSFRPLFKLYNISNCEAVLHPNFWIGLIQISFYRTWGLLNPTHAHTHTNCQQITRCAKVMHKHFHSYSSAHIYIDLHSSGVVTQTRPTKNVAADTPMPVYDTSRGPAPFLWASPRLPVLPHESHECVYLSSGDVFLQQLAVVVEQSRYCVFCQHIVPDLLLHEAELLGYVFLWRRGKRGMITGQEKAGVYEKGSVEWSCWVNLPGSSCNPAGNDATPCNTACRYA